MTQLVKAGLDGDWPAAQEIHEKYYPHFSGFLKLDSNPVPIKAAMHLAGHCDPGLRLPMVALNEEKSAELKTILSNLDLV